MVKGCLTSLLALMPLAAIGAGDDLFINQRNAANTATLTRQVTHPSGVLDGLLAFDGATALPVFFTLGPGLSVSSGVIDSVVTAPDWADITGKPTEFTPEAHTHAAGDVVSGVLDDSRVPALAISKTTGLQSALDAKFNTPAGTIAEYVRGNGTLATLPVAKRLEGYTGTTDANGLFTVTYPVAFSATPSVLPEQTTSANQFWVKVSSTTTGFSFRLVQRAALTVLSLELLAANVTNVSGASVRVQVIE